MTINTASTGLSTNNTQAALAAAKRLDDVTLSLIANSQSAATANADAINAKLATGGLVEVLPSSKGGEIIIDQTLLIPSGTTLVVKDGGVLKVKDGINAILPICNAGLYQTPATVTVSAIANHVATISWPAHGLTRDKCICLQGSDIPEYNLPFRIRRIVDANTIQVTLPDYTESLPSGNLAAYVMDRDIVIDAQIHYNAAQTVDSPAFNAHGAIFAFIADSYIKVRTEDTAKYSCQIGGSLNCVVDDGGESNSDLLKVYGATRDLTCRVSGSASDDCISFQGKEPAEFAAYQPSFGPIYGVTLEKISAVQNTTASHSGGIVVYSDDENRLRSIKIASGSVTSSTSNPLAFKPGTDFTAAQSLIESVEVGGVELIGDVGTPAICFTNIGKLTFDSTVFRPTTTSGGVFAHSAGHIGTLTFKDINFDLVPFDDAAGFLLTVSSSVDLVVFDNCRFEGNVPGDNARLMTVSAAGTVGTVLFKGGIYRSLEYMLEVQAGGASTPTIVLDNPIINDVTYVVACNVPAKVYANCQVNNIYRLVNSGTGVNIDIYGDNNVAQGNLFRTISGSTFTPHNPNQQVNINSAEVLQSVGAQCFSIAAAGTIPASRPVISDGTSWFDMTDPANSYTPT